MKVAETYPLLCELAGTLVLAVAEEFNDAALVRSESVQSNQISSMIHRASVIEKERKERKRKNAPGDLLDDVAHELRTLAHLALGPADSGLGDPRLGFLHTPRTDKD